MDDNTSGFPELDKAYELMRKDPQKALDMCDEFASRNEPNWMLHLTRIRANNRLSNWKNACQSADEYVKFRPDHSQPYWARAEASYRVGQYQQSIADIQQTIALDETKYMGSMPYRLMAMNHAQLSNLPEAMANADKADEMETHEWFPPIGCLPSGTMPQFKAHLARLASKT